MPMSPNPTPSMTPAEMKARVEAFEMLTKTSPFLMQYQSNMPLVNPFDPQAPLPVSGTNPNPLSLADVPMPSFQEMLNGPDAKQVISSTRLSRTCQGNPGIGKIYMLLWMY